MFLDFGFSRSLEYLHFQHYTSGIGPNLNINFIYVSYILNTHSLKVIVYGIFSEPAF